MASGANREAVQLHNQESCSAVESIDIIGEEWRLHVLYDLREGEKRFNELKRSTNANSRTLSQALDTLTEFGLVERRAERTSPIAVYYSLTEKGRSLDPVFEALEAWATDWLEPAFAPE